MTDAARAAMRDMEKDSIDDKELTYEEHEEAKETFNFRPNGFFKADGGKIDYTLVEPFAYEDLGKQLTIGAAKYERDNWQKGDMLTYIAALERHVVHVKQAISTGDLDGFMDDTGVQHGGALMFNSMAVHYFIRKELEGK